MSWQKSLKGKIKRSEPLKAHTSFRLGGPAKYFIWPVGSEDLRKALALAKNLRLSFLVIGQGSNLLVSDTGVKAVVVKLSAPYFKRISFRGNIVTAASGCLLGQLIKASKENGLSGLEFLTGIPGTLGGALMMNAGIPGKNIAPLVRSLTLMDYKGNVRVLSGRQIKFGYRKSNLSGYIILSCCLGLKKKNKKDIDAAIKKYILERKAKQNLNYPSAGCIFKNPPGDSAGRLIDACGLKGTRAGGAVICRKHANFILNSNNAKAGDVLRLMELIEDKVREKFKVNLKPEIKIWK